MIKFAPVIRTKRLLCVSYLADAIKSFKHEFSWHKVHDQSLTDDDECEVFIDYSPSTKASALGCCEWECLPFRTSTTQTSLNRPLSTI